MAFALDIAVIFIVISTAIIGYCRGFVRYAIKMLGTIACIIIALIVSDILAPSIYDSFVVPKLQERIAEQMQDFDVTATIKSEMKKKGYDVNISNKEIKEALNSAENVSHSLTELAKSKGLDEKSAKSFKEDIDNYLENDFISVISEKVGIENIQQFQDSNEYSKGVINDMIRAFASDDNYKGAEYLTDALMKSFMITIVRFILFIIILIISESILAIVFAIAGIFDRIPIINGVNKFFGLAAGLVKGALYLSLLAFIAATIVKSAGNELGGFRLNTKVIDQTYIFKYIFYIFYK